MYKGIIFDLDGTLLDTLTDLSLSVNYALSSLSLPERSIEEVKAFIGNGVKKLIERSVPEGTDKETEEKCFDTFESYYLLHMEDNTKPYDGIKELLSALKKKGFKTAIVSNKLHSAVVGLSEKEFGESIDLALGVNTEEERKPNPLNVKRAIESFGLQKNECIYIGDSDVDVQTAKNAGLECIGVTWGFRSREVLEKSGADYFADSPKDIIGIIEKQK